MKGSDLKWQRLATQNIPDNILQEMTASVQTHKSLMGPMYGFVISMRRK